MTTSTAAAALKPGTYRIDTVRSTVRFTARGMFGLVPVAGTFQLRHGSVTVAPDLADSSVTAVIDAGSVNTANERRDKDLRSARFLDTTRYPEIAFAGDTVRDGEVTGVLRAHGESRRIALAPSAEVTAGACHFTATIRIDRYAFGLTGGKGFVSRHTDVELDVWCVALGQ